MARHVVLADIQETINELKCPSDLPISPEPGRSVDHDFNTTDIQMEPSGGFVEEDEETQPEGLGSVHIIADGEKGEPQQEELESGHTTADGEKGELKRQGPKTEDGQIVTDGEKDLGHTGEGHATASVGYGGFADKDKASNIEQATQIRSQGLSAGQDSCEVVNEKNDVETGIRLGPSHEKDDTDKTCNMNAFEMDGTLGRSQK